MKVNNEYIFPCRCGKMLGRLSTEDAEGNKGSAVVNFDLLEWEERVSLRQIIPVPYDEKMHKAKLHIHFCDLRIPRCRTCGMKLAYFVTKPNPKKLGHKRPGKMPMGWDKITKEERYRFVLGLPVEYSAIEHRDKTHWANKECIDPALKQYRERNKIESEG